MLPLVLLGPRRTAERLYSLHYTLQTRTEFMIPHPFLSQSSLLPFMSSETLVPEIHLGWLHRKGNHDREGAAVLASFLRVIWETLSMSVSS